MNPDFLDLLRAFLGADVRFLVVGAYALGVHGRPRATKGFDVWVAASAENAPKVVRALRAFGAPLVTAFGAASSAWNTCSRTSALRGDLRISPTSTRWSACNA